ncbi:nucleolar complex protein 2 [Euwallacea fornicatus]|uniref:nucleolar complex protein 2 n=1 Tax=Euwallacea fornicatus TaxID=995702 RepID=UPI00338E3481
MSSTVKYTEEMFFQGRGVNVIQHNLQKHLNARTHFPNFSKVASNYSQMVKSKKPVVKMHKKQKLTKKPAKKVPKGKLSGPKNLKKTPLKLKPEPESSDSEVEAFINEPEDSEHELSGEEVEKSASETEEEWADEELAEKHKQDLEKLKKTDPEFYKFLQENDKKLLQFSISDEEAEDSEKDEEEDAIHRPKENLEVASDESDFEVDDKEEQEGDSRLISLKMIKTWQNDIQTDKSNQTITKLCRAFHAALRMITKDGGEPDDDHRNLKVEGSAVFNAVIQLCVLHLGPAIRRFLGLQSGSKQPPHKSKKFNKIKGILKTYFTDLLKLLIGVTSSNIQTVVLKHLHYMSPMLNSYTNTSKSILTKLIRIWGTAEDSVRVLAFFCILRIVNHQMAGTLNLCLKSMYMTYVKNSKFVSISTLAPINFMRRSLVEMYTLDLNVAYSHVFLYIRQLAIHLRNAVTVKKTENIQSVYNWQFINSLRLWGMLLSATQNKPQMQQLVYPFVQVCLGTIKLVPTAQCYPLRFHVVQILIDFTKETGVFIPVLPFLLEVLTSHDFNKKHQKVSMKPLHFTCILRLSKSQLQENGFKDTVIDTIYSQLLEYLSVMSHTIAFPDLSIFCVLQIKQFLKKSKMSNYNRKLKQALEKIEQNSQFIESERAKLTVNLIDVKQIEGWEAQIKVKGTPLTAFYESWSKIRNMKKNKEITNNHILGDYKLPLLKKHEKKAKDSSEGPIELFPSDSEDEEIGLEKKKRGKRGGKNVAKKLKENIGEEMDVDDQEDVVENISADDW